MLLGAKYESLKPGLLYTVHVHRDRMLTAAAEYSLSKIALETLKMSLHDYSNKIYNVICVTFQEKCALEDWIQLFMYVELIIYVCWLVNAKKTLVLYISVKLIKT